MSISNKYRVDWIKPSDRYLSDGLKDERSLEAICRFVDRPLLDQETIVEVGKKQRSAPSSTEETSPYLLKLLIDFSKDTTKRLLLSEELFNAWNRANLLEKKQNKRDGLGSVSHLLGQVEQSGIPVSLIIDVGFARGTPDLETVFKNAHYLAVDPSSQNFSWMDDFKEKRDNVSVFKGAVSDFSGEANLRVPVSATNSSLLVEAALEEDAIEKVSVERLDNLVKPETYDGWIILKTDTEGSDFSVLKGAEGILEKVGIVMSELRLDDPNNKNSFSRVVEFLSRFNFSFYRMYNYNYRVHGTFRQADVIFMKDKLLTEFNRSFMPEDKISKAKYEVLRKDKQSNKLKQQTQANEKFLEKGED